MSIGLSFSVGVDAAAQSRGGGVPLLPGFSYTKESYATWQSGLAATGCVVEDLGLCSDGVNKVYGLQHGDAEKPVLFLLGQIHGNHEWPGAYIMRQFMAYLASPPEGFESKFASILDTFQVYCIPCANPWGYINTNRRNANGVDLNRNFDVFWQTYDDSDGWGTKGSAPFSEAESQIIRDKVLELGPVGFVDFHIEGTATDARLVVLKGADEGFWQPLGESYASKVGPSGYTYSRRDGLPQSQQWVRSQIGSNGKKPMSATFEAGAEEADEEKARLLLNFTLEYCLSMVEQVANGWPQADAVVTTFQPAEAVGLDTQIGANAPDANYGTMSTMGIGDSSGIRRALLAFAMPGIDPGVDVQSAVITLTCSSQTNATPRTIELHRALKQWYEGNVNGTTPGPGVDGSTWNNRNHNGPLAWGVAGGQSGTDYDAAQSDSASVAALGEFQFDVTSDVQAFLSGNFQNFGWFGINAAEATAFSRKVFASSNAGDSATRPKLVVTAK